MILKDNVLGVVLAGGLSRRMGEKEKSLEMVDGKTLVEMVTNRFASQLPQIIINANGDAGRFSWLELPVQADTIDGFVGPLAGVLAGMRWAQDNAPHCTHVVTVAADTPFFPADFVEKMIATANDSNSDIALASSKGRRHPVFGLWRISLSGELEDFLVAEAGRKVLLFVERYANCLVDFASPDDDSGKPDPFFNVNTPEELLRVKPYNDRMNKNG